MAEFETLINDAIAAQDLPGCVLVASNRDGSFKYAKTFGNNSMKAESAQPIQFNTVMWGASCTKLMTSICCLQLVERGLLTLDEPVYKYIPELESFNILVGFEDDGKPIEVKHTKPITLRLLLSHTSGLTYDIMDPRVAGWLKYHNREPRTGTTVLERFSVPLVFEPGESWMYGASTDYAGLLVERVTGETLEAYMKTNLWEPLGIKDMTFHLDKRPDMKARMADMSLRDPETDKMRHTDTPMPYLDSNGKEASDCFGGQGIFLTAEEYIKVVHALLVCDEDEKIFKKSTLDDFFKYQLDPKSSAALNAIVQNDQMNNAMGGTPKDIKKDWGLGGILLTSDTSGGKKAGTIIWAGAPNLTWWCDRKSGLCGFYASQVWPPGDAKVAVLNRKFEDGMYEMLAQQQGQNEGAGEARL